jgi:hypothetical protein
MSRVSDMCGRRAARNALLDIRPPRVWRKRRDQFLTGPVYELGFCWVADVQNDHAGVTVRQIDVVAIHSSRITHTCHCQYAAVPGGRDTSCASKVIAIMM